MDAGYVVLSPLQPETIANRFPIDENLLKKSARVTA